MGRRKQRAPAPHLGGVESRPAFQDALAEPLHATDGAGEDTDDIEVLGEEDVVNDPPQPPAKRRWDVLSMCHRSVCS